MREFLPYTEPSFHVFFLRVLVIDEGTTGVGLASRSAVWTALSNLKKTTSIIMTTSDVDDVVAIADRAAILGFGGLKCCGKTGFLRRCYGSGYNVNVYKGAKFQTKRVLQALQALIPSAHILQDHKDFVKISLGERNGYAPVAAAFKTLETEQQRLAIASFTVTVITMEDIFLRVILELDASDLESKRRAATVDRKRQSFVGDEQIEYSEGNILMATEKVGGVTKIEEYYESSVKIENHVKALCDLKTGKPSRGQIFVALITKRGNYTRNTLGMPIFCWLLPAALLFAQCELETESRRRISVTFSADSLPYDPSFVHPSAMVFLEAHDSPDVADAYRTFAKTEKLVLKEFESPVFSNFLNKLMQRMSREETPLFGAQFASNKSNPTKFGKALAWYNGEAYHTLSLSIGAVSNVLLKRAAKETNAKIVTVLKPFKNGSRIVTSRNLENMKKTNDLETMIRARVIRLLLVPLATSVIVASFIVFPIDDRLTSSKKMQLISGVPPSLCFGRESGAMQGPPPSVE